MAPLGLCSYALLALLATLLVAAMVTDLRSRVIGNGLNLAVALLALPWWLSLGLGPGAVLLQIGIAMAVLLAFMACFALGMMGGGDVKLLAALALWLPLGDLTQMLMVMAIGGGVLTLVMMIRHRRAAATTPLEVPYGVAIAGAGLLILANDILTIPVA